MKHAGTSILRPAKVCRSAALRPLVRQRYHCRPPWKPVRSNSAVKTRSSSSGSHWQAAIAAGRGHRGRHRCRHVLVQIHDVVGRQLGELLGAPGGERERPVLRAVRALVVEVGAQEGVDALRAMPHVGVGGARRVVPLVMLARALERREVVVDGVDGCGGERRRAGERRAQQRDGREHVRPHESAGGRDRRAEVVADHRRDLAAAERGEQPEHVPHEVEQAERLEVAVVVGVPAGRAAVAALVGRHHVVARGRERRHDLAPAPGELGEAVQQQHTRPARRLEAGLEDVHREAVDVLDEPRAQARRAWQRAHQQRAHGERADHRVGRGHRGDVGQRVVDRGAVPVGVHRRAAVLGHDRDVALVGAGARGVLDRHVGPGAGDDDRVAPAALQHGLEARALEGAHPHLLHQMVARAALEAGHRLRSPAAA